MASGEGGAAISKNLPAQKVTAFSRLSRSCRAGKGGRMGRGKRHAGGSLGCDQSSCKGLSVEMNQDQPPNCVTCNRLESAQNVCHMPKKQHSHGEKACID